MGLPGNEVAKNVIQHVVYGLGGALSIITLYYWGINQGLMMAGVYVLLPVFIGAVVSKPVIPMATKIE